jgi:hypothetical protein
MTAALFRKRLGALRPADGMAEEQLSRIRQDEEVRVEIKRVRSPQQLRYWWALCGVLAEYADWCEGDRERASDWLKLSIGHAETFTSPDGKQWIRPKSIAFGNCPQDRFQAVMDAAIKVICEKIMPGTSNADLRNELEGMI